MVTSTGAFITALTSEQRVLVIGGLAVIAHGFNRPTMELAAEGDPFSQAVLEEREIPYSR